MNINRLLCGTLYFVLCTYSAFAQMNNVVEVENTYAPTLRDVDKIQLLPPVPSPVLKHRSVQYDTTLQPTRQYSFQPMTAAQSDAADTGERRGFLTLGGGSAGQLDLRGTYGLRLTDADLLDFSLSLRGYSARVQDAWDTDDEVDTRFYSTRGAVRYEHRFAPLTSLVVGAEGESQVMDGQHNTLLGIQAQLTPYSLGDFSLGGGLGYEFFGQKYHTNPLISGKKNQESHFDARLNAAYTLTDEQRIGLDLTADFYAYSFASFDANNAFSLRPYYAYTADDLLLTAGARLDFTSGIERKFRVAPDVNLRYHATDAVTLFAGAGGGIVANDYRRFAQLTPYWLFDPAFVGKNGTPQLAHQFDLLRAKAGVEWNLAEGLFARLYGGYDKSKGRAELLTATQLVQADGWRWYGHLDVDYRLRDTFAWKLSGEFNAWHSSYGTDDDDHAEATAWRPVIDLQTDITYRPVNRLSLGIDYAMQTFSTRSGLSYRRPTMHRLGASASYRLPIEMLENQGRLLSAYVRADNLLGRHYDLYPAVRTPGTNFMAGLSLTF